MSSCIRWGQNFFNIFFPMEARSSISGKTNPFLIFLDLSRKLISKSSSSSGPLTSFPINFLHFPAAVCTVAITKSPHLSMTRLSVCGARLKSPSDRLALLSESANTSSSSVELSPDCWEKSLFFTGERVMMAEETLLRRRIFRGLAFGSGAIDSIKEVSGTAYRLQPGFDDAGVDVDWTAALVVSSTLASMFVSPE